MVLGAQPTMTQMPAQQPLQAPPVQSSPLVQALLAGSGAPQQTSSAPAQISGMNMGMLAQMFGQKPEDSGLLAGARSGDPRLLNALRFALDPNVSGVNPWTYGMSSQPGGQVDSAGNFSV